MNSLIVQYRHSRLVLRSTNRSNILVRLLSTYFRVEPSWLGVGNRRLHLYFVARAQTVLVALRMLQPGHLIRYTLASEMMRLQHNACNHPLWRP